MKALKIQISGSGSEMQGVGRLADGRVVFVRGALPGETVSVEITREAPRFVEARLLDVVEASPDRYESTCPYAERCGGCAARHMSYDCSLRLKRQRVYDALTRIGGVANAVVRNALPSPKVNHYRNKAEYAVQYSGGRLSIGFFAPNSHRVIDIDDCLLQHSSSVKALNWLRKDLPKRACTAHIRYLVTRVNRDASLSIVLCSDAPVQEEAKQIALCMKHALPELESAHFCRLRQHPSHALDGKCFALFGSETITDRLCGLIFELSPQSFFQVNPEQTETLYGIALDAAQISSNTHLLDIYCGAGTISLAAAKRGATVTGIEIVEPAVENAKRNAQRNQLSGRANFICGDAAHVTPRLIAKGTGFDCAVIDPPRRGADAETLNALADAKLDRIVYVSCNPSTLARDVKLLAAREYVLEWAQPVDMFPWTEHVETVVLLSKGEIDSKKVRVEFSLENMDMSGFQKGATYPQIKEYVQEHSGLKVSSLYISQVKRKCGLDVGQNYNLSKKEGAKQPQCPPEKEKAIMEALQHFGMI